MTARLDDTLQLGLFDWIEWDKSAPHEIYEQRLKMLEFADSCGFYCYHLAEHHITPLSIAPSPAVFLAAAAQRTALLHLLGSSALRKPSIAVAESSQKQGLRIS